MRCISGRRGIYRNDMFLNEYLVGKLQIIILMEETKNKLIAYTVILIYLGIYM